MRSFIFGLVLVGFFVGTVQAFFPEANATLESTQFWAESHFKPGSNVAVVNFRVWFKHPPEKVFKVLTDTNSLKHQLSNFNDSRTLTKQLFKQIVDSKPSSDKDVLSLIGDNKINSSHNRSKGQNWTDYVYYKFNFPWPLTDRWAVQKVRVDETNSNKGEYKYEYKMHVGNFKTLFGYWKLVPVEGHPGWTEFRGSYESDPGVAVPKFITKKAVKTGLKKDVGSYREVLSR